MLSSYLLEAWHVTVSLAPWLLLGLAVAGVLHVLVPSGFVARHLGGGGIWGAVKAAALGVPMPLCSCGVIPAALGLRRHGASRAATVSFLTSTPQTGVDSIAVSAAILGLPFALIKVVTAFVTGVVAGGLVSLSETAGEQGVAEEEEERLPHGLRARLCEAVRFSVEELLGGIWIWVLAGVLVSAGLSLALDAGQLSQYAWSRGLAGMLSMLAVSVPLYVCATGSVPVAAALVHAGMSPGSTLVFLMAGPATNVATLGAVYRALGARALAVYVGTIVVASTGMGLLFDSVLGPAFGAGTAAHAAEHAGPVGFASGVALILLMGYHLVRAARRRLNREPLGDSCSCGDSGAGEEVSGVEVLSLRVRGMSCQSCAAHIVAAVTGVPNVVKASVDLAGGIVRVQGKQLDADHLAAAIRDAGYQPVEDA